MDVTITTTDGGKVAVTSPYDPDFVAEAHKIGGRWNGTNAWEFDPRSEQAARDLCKNIYGTDGSDNDQPRVTIRIPLHASVGQEFRPAGEKLVWRPSRDAPVRFAGHVVLVEGDFPSRGGSAANPRLEPDNGTVIEVRDLTPGAAQKIINEWKNAVVVDAAPADNTARIAALQEERTRLTSRLAQIDEELSHLTRKVDA
jgi:hypothetical protein